MAHSRGTDPCPLPAPLERLPAPRRAFSAACCSLAALAANDALAAARAAAACTPSASCARAKSNRARQSYNHGCDSASEEQYALQQLSKLKPDLPLRKLTGALIAVKSALRTLVTATAAMAADAATAALEDASATKGTKR